MKHTGFEAFLEQMVFWQIGYGVHGNVLWPVNFPAL
jgi:hypothetical protein